MDYGGCGTVAGELRLESVDWVGFCGDVAAFEGAPGGMGLVGV